MPAQRTASRLAIFWNWLFLSVAVLAAQSPAALPVCQATPVVKTTDTLTSLSTAYFADQRYQWSILLATNAHSGDTGYQYISDPGNLPANARVCIPALPDAERLRAIYDRYLAALDQARLPTIDAESDSLVSVDPSKTLKVVTWIRASQITKYRTDHGPASVAASDIWVTVEPMLQRFCRQYTSTRPVTSAQLTERLEQRLGLPPGAGKTHFVEITINDPSSLKHLFRPCAEPSTFSHTCLPGTPSNTEDATYRLWFLSQYYSSYGTALPYSYPWTALGYTFDWGLDDNGHTVRVGESEFVIPQGAPIQVGAITTTGDYCGIRNKDGGNSHD
jgi:hypothetical protein